MIKREPTKRDLYRWTGLEKLVPGDKCFYLMASISGYVKFVFGVMGKKKKKMHGGWTALRVCRISGFDILEDQVRHQRYEDDWDAGFTVAHLKEGDIAIGGLFPMPSREAMGLEAPVLARVQQEMEEVLF